MQVGIFRDRKLIMASVFATGWNQKSAPYYSPAGTVGPESGMQGNNPGNLTPQALAYQQNAQNMPQYAAQAASMADPWASQRGQYQTSLSQLMNNPGAAMQDNPFFKWQQQQGENAVNRAAAANGQLGSGNRMAALSDYSQKQAGNNYFQLADLYSLLGGAKNQNPGAAAQIQYQGYQDMQQQPLDWARMSQPASMQANQDFTQQQGFQNALAEKATNAVFRQLGGY
jgi:hypothetical protein